MAKPRVTILGAGPAGLGAAYRLTRESLAHVTVIEKCEKAGGLSGSFEVAGINVDYGSHRLHPSCDPEILDDIMSLLGNDLLKRPRHGRIRLCGRWIHFPLRLLDLIMRLPPSFSWGVAADTARKIYKKRPVRSEEDTFASVLEHGLGKTVFYNFYSPYAEKMWGTVPEDLSSVQAYRRVSSNSSAKILGKLLRAAVGSKQSGRGKFFYYPRKGFGQIPGSFYTAAAGAGAEFFFDSTLRSIKTNGKTVSSVGIEYGKEYRELETDFIWSAIPIPDLLQYLGPAVPSDIAQASSGIEYRSLVLIYLVLEQKRFSEYDAHYFPEKDIPITRVSEPKNYSDVQGTGDFTVLCAELPCSEEAPEWSMTEQELGKLVRDSLLAAGIPVENPVQKVIALKLKNAYPVYRRDFETHFTRIDEWLGGFDNLITFGRHGLFAHDNIHHALFMGYSAAKCLDDSGVFDAARWREYREVFEAHVVED